MTSSLDETAETRRKERLGYIVLQHVHTFSAEPSLALSPDNIASALAITYDEVREILTKLAEQGFVSWAAPNAAVLVTREGEDYLLHGAARRRSVRFRSIRRPNLPRTTDGTSFSPGRSTGTDGASPNERTGSNKSRP